MKSNTLNKSNKSFLSLRVTKDLKTILSALSNKKSMTMSEFIITGINKEYEYIKQLQRFSDICNLIDYIIDILNHIILDKHNNPYVEFNNDFVLYIFRKIKKSSVNFTNDFSYFNIEHYKNKTESISVRLDNCTNKNLKYITNFYNCKKSDIVSLILSKKENNRIVINALKCFCYITDIKNYFYEQNMNFEDFERRYIMLWEMIQ